MELQKYNLFFLYQETFALTKRLFIQLKRRPSTLLAGILQPIIWLFLFGALFSKAPQGFSINFVADKQKDLLTKLKVELAFSKFEIFSLTQSQPSLDDVYLQATGKTLLDAEISMAGKRDLKKESKQSMR